MLNRSHDDDTETESQYEKDIISINDTDNEDNLCDTEIDSSDSDEC